MDRQTLIDAARRAKNTSCNAGVSWAVYTAEYEAEIKRIFALAPMTDSEVRESHLNAERIARAMDASESVL